MLDDSGEGMVKDLEHKATQVETAHFFHIF